MIQGRAISNSESTSFLKKVPDILKKIFSFVSTYGVKNEKDEVIQKYMILSNLVSAETSFTCTITGILFFCIGEFLPGLSILVASIIWIFPIYLNRNGNNTLARFLAMVFSNILILVGSILFSHDTILDVYYLNIAATSCFLYSYKEIKWLITTLFFSIVLFIIESTSLQDYLPSYNLAHNSDNCNVVLLFGLILTFILNVISYVYVNTLRENSLLVKQRVLEKAERDLSLQNEDLKTFSIAASHSMQTPVYVAAFFIEKLLEEVKPFVKEDIINNIELIKNGINQIETLVSGLFSYNRILNIENESVVFDLFKEINIAKKNIIPKYPNAFFLIPNVEIEVKSNLLLFSIIIYNLFDNGLKYNQSKIPTVSLEFSKTKNGIILFVKDNGIGIPQEYFTTIFEPFKRLQAGINLKKGNGLGLVGAKRAAERIGGSLVCEQSTAEGTVFKIEIPYV